MLVIRVWNGPVTTLSRGAVTVSCDHSGSTGEQQEVWLLRRRRAMGRGVYRLRHGTRGVPLLTLLCSLSNVVNMQPMPPPPHVYMLILAPP